MIKIFIQGINDGKHEVNLSIPVKSIPDISAEFFGNVEINGIFRKHHQRYTIQCDVSCNVNLICDLSLKEYTDTVSFEFNEAFIKDNQIFFEQKNRELRDNEEKAMHEDDKYIDITEDIREELFLHLPMKRCAPEYRNKNFEDLYPQFSNKKNIKKSEQKIDDHWSALKKIKLD